MLLIRGILAAVAVFYGVQWYQSGPTDEKAPSVPSNVILDISEELFPPGPQGALGAVLGPLDGILKGQTQDSLVLARAYRDVASLTARTPGAVTLNEYAQDYKNFLKILFLNTSLAGKYPQFEPTVEAAYKEAMKPFADSAGEFPNQEINQEMRQALVNWALSVSGKCHEVYLKNLQEVK